MTGGGDSSVYHSAELLDLASNRHCQLPDIIGSGRAGHTQV